MKICRNIAAAIILLAILFAFVSPMFDLPVSALRAFRVAIALMLFLVSAAFIAAGSLDLARFAMVGETQKRALSPAPLEMSFSFRC